MQPGLWIAAALISIWLLWLAGVRHIVCPPLAFVLSVAVSVMLFAYVGVSSGAYVQNTSAHSFAQADNVASEKPKTTKTKRPKKRTAQKVAQQL
ncbi:MAG: hypothetical protein EBR02_01910 [Alphaproteobacteria bacterium]|nr:hypothetical protein [Alphaproteobacteria bacterium]